MVLAIYKVYKPESIGLLCPPQKFRKELFMLRLFKTGFSLAILTAFTLASSAQAQRVAILGAPNDPTWNTDVQNKLISTGLFSTVDVYNISATTPSLATLQTYGSVLVYTDGVVGNTTALGNELDTYVRGGGGVVDAVFANASIPVTGAFQANNDYSILPAGQGGGTVLTLVPVNAGSPLLAGVTSFNGGTASYYGTGSLNPNSTLVANWSNGAPLVAYQGLGSGIEVSLNFFPPSSDVRNDFWISSTNGARLMGNALLFAAPAAVPEPGSIALLIGMSVTGAGFVARRRKSAKAA